MTAIHTHAAAYRITDTDPAGVVAFVREGNHCPCDAVRCNGLVVYQSAGFDGPHMRRAYEVVRESDGAAVESIEEHAPSALCYERGIEQTFAAWASGHVESDDDLRAAIFGRAPHAPHAPLDGRRLRFDPHPAGFCRHCL